MGMVAMKNTLLIFLLIFCSSALAALNRWVDPQGHVHYSDQPPPPDVDSKVLRSSSDSLENGESDAESQNGIAGDEIEGSKSLAEQEVEKKRIQKEKEVAAEKASKEQANAESMKAYCNSARQNLRALQEGLRMTEIDINGERIIMEDEKRQQNISKIQQDISKNCK